MSFELTNENLQNIAARCTAIFLTKQASLSEALAKEAMDLELNPDQIHRAIEATNTVAYLKQLEESPDRTFEFPVADYKEVIAKMVLPEEVSAANPIGNDYDPAAPNNEIVKNDATGQGINLGYTDFEKVALLNSSIVGSLNELRSIEEQKSANMFMLLEKKAGLGDEVWENTIKSFSTMTDLEKKASSVFSLYTQGQELLKREKDLRDSLEKAAELMEKFAVAGLVARGVGAMVGGLAKSVGSSIGKPLANVGRFSSSASKKGMSTNKAVETYDRIAKTQGSGAAKAHFGGAKPSMIHRKGVGKTLDTAAAAATGLTATHQTGVWENLQKN